MNRVTDPADPKRCQAAAPDGQCMNEQEHGASTCKAHGGRSTAETEEKKLYLLTEARYRTRLAQLAEHEEVKSLREEIALARMLIERRFDLIKNDNDLLNACGPINTMLLTVERLVKSAHTIEQNLGALLAKPTVLKLGQQMCEIVVTELEGIENYEAIVDRITSRVIDSISKANNPEQVK
jgi:hypothetical protein